MIKSWFRKHCCFVIGMQLAFPFLSAAIAIDVRLKTKVSDGYLFGGLILIIIGWVGFLEWAGGSEGDWK